MDEEKRLSPEEIKERLEKEKEESEGEVKKVKEVKTKYITGGKQLYEMLFDKEASQTCFVSVQDGKIKKVQFIEASSGKKIVPFKPENNLLHHNFVKFPSELTGYENELKLCEEIQSFIKKYVDLSDDFVVVSSVYVMMTWLYDQFRVLPYLRVVGIFGTGKSRFLEVVGNLSYKPMFASGSMSIASVFRTIDEIQGTLVLDEADFKNTEASSEIAKIFNTGHADVFPVLRMKPNAQNKDFDTKAFKVFGPKIIGSRERFRDEALESRCLSYSMFPRKDVKSPVTLPREFEDEALHIRNKLLQFRFKYFGKINYEKTRIDDVKIPRLKQTFLSIFYVAELISNEIAEQITEFAKEYEKDLEANQATTLEADVLFCIGLILFDDRYIKRIKGRIGMGNIAEKFNQFYDAYSEKNERSFGPMAPILFKVSARRIGNTVKRKLNLKTARDRHGYYIQETEYKKIISLLERYGLTEEVKKELQEQYKSDKESKKIVDAINLEHLKY